MSFAFNSMGGGSFRRRRAEQRRKVFMIAAAIAALSAVSYWWGGENVRSSEVAYKQQAMRLTEEREGLEKTIVDLRSDVEATQLRYQQLEERFKNEIPEGELKKLTDILRKQLQSGIKPERLAFLLEAARPPKNCTEPQMKRFVVKTPAYSGPHGSVSFGNGAVIVSAEGQSAIGAGGSFEAWYDPGKEVKVIFSQIGGKQVVKEGLLPVQHSVIVGSREYRFTVAAGERSFIAVTSDNCDYP
jgi:hypothetical protein